jgi:hypothetical protein
MSYIAKQLSHFQPKKYFIHSVNYKYVLQKEYYSPCCICYEEYKMNNFHQHQQQQPFNYLMIADFELCEFLNNIRFDNKQICIISMNASYHKNK